MSDALTDSQGNYFMSFSSKDYGSYYVSFAKNNQYIFDSDNMQHYLNNSSNIFDFKIRKSKIFKTRLIVQNNYHRPLSIYNGYGSESQSVKGINKDTILYFKADQKEINMFQMYVQEMDYGHYWYKMEIKDGNSSKDTISIEIDANINNFKRYKANENP